MILTQPSNFSSAFGNAVLNSDQGRHLFAELINALGKLFTDDKINFCRSKTLNISVKHLASSTLLKVYLSKIK